MKKSHKYHAVSEYVDGYRFPSKLQADCYRYLKFLKGEIIEYFLWEVPIHLKGKEDKEDYSVTYRCDFQIFFTDRRVAYWDTKGYVTPQSKLKKAMVEQHYPIKVHFVSAADLEEMPGYGLHKYVNKNTEHQLKEELKEIIVKENLTNVINTLYLVRRPK